MLIGYVSDERYVALPDVFFELQSESGESDPPVVARSTARGAVYAELEPGPYRVTHEQTRPRHRLLRTLKLPASLLDPYPIYVVTKL